MKRIASFAILLFAAGLPLVAQAEPTDVRVLSLTALEVSPEKPGVETLCQLRIEVQNSSDKTVSELAFAVAINGQPIDVYEAQLYYQQLPPSSTTEIRLFNFWTTETDREPAPDGKLTVAVTLEAARYVKIETTRENDQDVETWTPLEPVSGLPISRSLELKLAAP